jgi:hypothetical protein
VLVDHHAQLAEDPQFIPSQRQHKSKQEGITKAKRMESQQMTIT